MKSDIPKPLHMIHGRELVNWVQNALVELDLDYSVTVVGHGREQVEQAIRDNTTLDPDKLLFAHQEQQLGTGDAAKVALAALDAEHVADLDELILILPGDVPLICAETITRLVNYHRETRAAAVVITSRIDNPTGYGRILRNGDGAVAAIIEHSDADDEQRKINEINAGIYSFNRSLLSPALRSLTDENEQGEFYLTDVVEVLNETGNAVLPMVVDQHEILGVNDQYQLSNASLILRNRINKAHLINGVNIKDATTVNIDVTVEIEPGVVIKPNCVIEGKTTIATGAVIGPNTHIVNSQIGAGVEVRSSSVIDSVIT